MSTLAELLAAFDGELIVPVGMAGWAPCPVCGRLTPRSVLDRVALCRACTEAEIGEYADELSARVGRRLTRKAYQALPRDSDGRPILPPLSYRAWRRLTG